MKGCQWVEALIDMRTIVLSFLFTLAVPTLGFAQPKAPAEDTLRFKRVTLVDFGELAVNAEITKPEGSLLLSRRNSSFPSLIRTRQNFRAEMVLSIDSL